MNNIKNFLAQSSALQEYMRVREASLSSFFSLYFYSPNASEDVIIRGIKIHAEDVAEEAVLAVLADRIFRPVLETALAEYKVELLKIAGLEKGEVDAFLKPEQKEKTK